MRIMPHPSKARLLVALGCAGAVALIAGCPPARPQGGGAREAYNVAKQGALKVTLVCTDLGLEDGYFVRDAYGALSDLESAGQISLTLAGTVPTVLETEARAGDIGLPLAESEVTEQLGLGETNPGTMTQAQAEALLQETGSPDLLVLSSETLLPMLKELESAGTLSPRAVLVLNGGPALASGKGEAAGPATWYFDYDILPAAFAGGVAAAVSSNNAKFIALASSADPKAGDWLDGLYAGAKWQSNGTGMITAVLQAGEDGEISPEEFKQGMAAARAEGGPDFAVNHYLAALGRATPSVLYALSSAPTSGYVVGGYGDICQVRPGRFIGCALKKPGNAIRWLFGEGAGDSAVKELLAAAGSASPEQTASSEPAAIKVGLRQQAVGFTDVSLYSRYNPDGDDIADAVQRVWTQLEAEEIDLPAVVQQYNRKAH